MVAEGVGVVAEGVGCGSRECRGVVAEGVGCGSKGCGVWLWGVVAEGVG